MSRKFVYLAGISAVALALTAPAATAAPFGGFLLGDEAISPSAGRMEIHTVQRPPEHTVIYKPMAAEIAEPVDKPLTLYNEAFTVTHNPEEMQLAQADIPEKPVAEMKREIEQEQEEAAVEEVEVEEVVLIPEGENEDGEERGLTLEETLVQAFQFSPILKAAREQVSITQENVSEALTGFLPTASANYNYGRQRNKFNDVRGYADVNDGSLEVSQPLFDGLSNFSAYSRSKKEVKASEHSLEATAQNVLLQAAVAHFFVARDWELLKLSQHNEDVHKAQLDATTRRFEVGDLTKTDVAQAAARHAEASASALKSKSDLAVSQSRYKQLVGMLPVATPVLPDSFGGVPASYKEALIHATQNNPVLAESESLKDAAEDAVDEAQGGLWPEVSLVGRMEKDKTGGVLQSTRLESGTVLVNVRVPLYEAGRTRSEIRRAHHRHRQSEQEFNAVRYEVEQQVSSSWQELQTSKDVIKMREDAVEAARAALNGYKKEYEMGSRSTVDVLDAERDLFNAERALIAARAEYAISAYRLKAALGELNVASTQTASAP